MPTALDPRIAADMGALYAGQSASFTGKFVSESGTVLASGLAFNEPVAGSGSFRCTTPTDTSWVGTVYYDGTGLTPPVAHLPSDPITVLAAGTDPDIAAILGIVEGFSFTNGAVNAYAVNIQQGGTVVLPASVSPAGVPNTNVAGDSPINQVRGTSLPLFMALVAGPQPVLPTDPIPPALDCSPAGTYFLFMVKYADADPDTNVPVPDNEALISLDSRSSQITVVQPATLGQLRTVIPAAATTITDVYGNMAMPNGIQLRWSLKVFLGDGMGGVASEQVPLSGPYTVFDRSVQVV